MCLKEVWQKDIFYLCYFILFDKVIIDTFLPMGFQAKSCKLVVESLDRIVAKGFVIETVGFDARIHGTLLGELNYRVSKK